MARAEATRRAKQAKRRAAGALRIRSHELENIGIWFGTFASDSLARCIKIKSVDPECDGALCGNSVTIECLIYFLEFSKFAQLILIAQLGIGSRSSVLLSNRSETGHKTRVEVKL